MRLENMKKMFLAVVVVVVVVVVVDVDVAADFVVVDIVVDIVVALVDDDEHLYGFEIHDNLPVQNILQTSEL